MSASDVFFVRGTRNESPKRLAEIARALYARIRPAQGLTGPVMVKVHVGDKSPEGEITTHSRPEWAAAFVQLLRNDGIPGSDIVLTDSRVNYAGTARSTVEGHMELARERGFVGFQVADQDGCVAIESERFDQLLVPKLIHQIAMAGGSRLSLVHFKAHGIFAYGGAIKNDGMGLVGRETKAATHHFKAMVDPEKCQGCGACIRACTHGAIDCTEEDSIAFVNPDICLGCFMCLDSCVHGALSMTMGDLGDIDTPKDRERVGRHITDSLVIAAKEAASLFQPGRSLYVTDLTRITAYCDCDVKAQEALRRKHLATYLTRKDFGYLASLDPVALDEACRHLVLKEIGEETWHQRLSVFPFYFPVALTRQTEKAEELGMGIRNYNLIEISLS